MRKARAAKGNGLARDHARSGLKALPLVAPVTLWMLAFQVVPLLLVLAVSFASRGRYGGIVWEFGVQNYLRFFDPLYLGILADSFIVAGLTTLIALVVGYPFAYWVATRATPWRNVLLLLVVVPFWTNMLIRTYAWMIILRGNGLLNQALMAIGLLDQPVQILYTRPASILGLTYVMLPFMILPLYASVEKLDMRLVRAAHDLGARPLQAFRRVVLPLTMPGVIAGSVIVFIPSLALFFVSELLGGANSFLIGNLIHRQFTQARDWPFGAAASIILTAVSLVLIFVYVRFFSPKDDEEWI